MHEHLFCDKKTREWCSSARKSDLRQDVPQIPFFTSLCLVQCHSKFENLGSFEV